MEGDAPKFATLQQGLLEASRMATAVQEHKDMIAGMKKSFPVCEGRLGAEADQILAPFRTALAMAEQHLCELEEKAKKTYAAMQATGLLGAKYPVSM